MSGSYKIKIHSEARNIMVGNRESNLFLEHDTFNMVVKSTPLISIDLIVRNDQEEILLGLRKNKPAEGFWFVPGGRVCKNESIGNAFKRLTFAELGIEIPISSARYLGLYEHFYEDSIFTDDLVENPVSTHYVVNAFEVVLSETKGLDKNSFKVLPKDQHDEYCWFTEDQLLKDERVHLHSKWYLNKDKGFL